MGLEHHGRAAAGVVTHHQARAVLFFQDLTALGVRLVVQQLVHHRLQQVDLHGLQVGHRASVLGVFLRQRREQRLQGLGNGFFVEMT
ncbi:hypothetical protein D9M69_608820 [compost metagenome]